MKKRSMEGNFCSPQFAVPKNQAAGPQKAPVHPLLAVTRAELLAALASYPLAYCYIALYAASPDWRRGGLVFTLLFWLWVECFCRGMGRPGPSRESRFWASCMVGLALASALWNNTTVLVWDVLALHGAAAYWVLCRAGCLAEGRTGPMLLLDCFDALVSYPFGCFFLRLRTLWHRLTRREGGKVLVLAAVTLLVVVPLLGFAAGQLAQADEGFGLLWASLTQDALRAFHLHLGELGIKLAFSLPVGAYLYGLAAGALRTHGQPAARQRAAALRTRTEQLRRLPPLALSIWLGTFCLLYLAFFGVQAGHLAAALGGQLPMGFSAAEYARSGFWQLCRVVALNMVLILAAARCSTVPLRRHRGLRAMTLALDGCSLLFAVVALCKLGLYIRCYGLTPTRVLALWCIAVLAALSVLIAATVLHPFCAVRAGVLLTAASFALLCLGNPDGLVIRTNLHLYESGVIQELDTWTLRRCGAARNPERYLRQLYRVDWYTGRSLHEIEAELGPAARWDGHTALWDAGWNIIDPELLAIEFEGTAADIAEGTALASSAVICEGAAAPELPAS